MGSSFYMSEHSSQDKVIKQSVMLCYASNSTLHMRYGFGWADAHLA